MRELWLVVGRELKEATRRKSFWIVLAVLALGSTAAVTIPELIDGGPDRRDVAVVGDPGPLEAQLGPVVESLGDELRVTSVEDLAAARRAVEDGDADVGVQAGAQPTIVVTAGEHAELVALVQQALAGGALADRLVEAGLSPQEAARAMDVRAAEVVQLDEERSDRRAVAAIVSIALYILLLALMIQVANGVAIEKSNRISEVLLAIVRPGPLLFGKVVGVGLIGMATLGAAAAPVVVKLLVGGDLPEGVAGALAASAAWFLLGIALYLIVAGALGALVERQEEAGSVVTPFTMALIGSYLVAQSAPDGPVATVLAYVPFSSPLVVPSRVAAGVSSPVEMAASLLLGVVAVVLVARIGAVVYRRAIVRTGRRLKLREVLGSSTTTPR
ncbi:MAG: ABC transporter permease [Acidimicrobiia bacterium]